MLVIDLDPQGNASTALGVEHRSETPSVYDVIINDVPMAEVVQSSPDFETLDCIPATIHLAGAEIELVSHGGARAAASVGARGVPRADRRPRRTTSSSTARRRSAC